MLPSKKGFSFSYQFVNFVVFGDKGIKNSSNIPNPQTKIFAHLKYFSYLCRVLDFHNKMKLVFASNNKHKLEEVRKILPANICVISLAELGFHAEIDETGETLEENSAIKAQTIWDWIKAHQLTHEVDGVFADDTGLEIRALGGAPGVRTARWAGEDCNDAANRQKALQELSGVIDREARFRTVITLITQQGTQQVEGIVNGRISETEEGNGGFGYDPVFIPEGYEKTFASLPTEVKNSISHRARALESLKKQLKIKG
jgi:XTP/dITP diphosphohydrolase